MWKKKQVKNDPEWIENKTLLLLPNKFDPDQPSNEKITWFGQLYLPNQKLQNSKKRFQSHDDKRYSKSQSTFASLHKKIKKFLMENFIFSAVRPILNLMQFIPERLRKIWLKSKYQKQPPRGVLKKRCSENM